MIFSKGLLQMLKTLGISRVSYIGWIDTTGSLTITLAGVCVNSLPTSPVFFGVDVGKVDRAVAVDDIDVSLWR